MTKRKLFLDLDGVLADFDRGVEAVTGRRPHELAPSQMWPALARHKEFYATLAMMVDAHELWAFCRPYNPVILTGLPRGDWAEPQKRRWVANMLGADVEVITTMSRDKHKFASPGAVLVDDRRKLKEAWEAAGGVFVHHVDAARSIAAFKRLGFKG